MSRPSRPTRRQHLRRLLRQVLRPSTAWDHAHPTWRATRPAQRPATTAPPGLPLRSLLHPGRRAQARYGAGFTATPIDVSRGAGPQRAVNVPHSSGSLTAQCWHHPLAHRGHPGPRTDPSPIGWTLPARFRLPTQKPAVVIDSSAVLGRPHRPPTTGPHRFAMERGRSSGSRTPYQKRHARKRRLPGWPVRLQASYRSAYQRPTGRIHRPGPGGRRAAGLPRHRWRSTNPAFRHPWRISSPPNLTDGGFAAGLEPLRHPRPLAAARRHLTAARGR